MKTRKLKTILIDLETFLHALEADDRNPNCYEETGKIRAKFRLRTAKDLKISPEKGKVKLIWEEEEEL